LFCSLPMRELALGEGPLIHPYRVVVDTTLTE
jgi:hypothetical protein